MRAALDKIEWGPNDEIGAANNMPPDIVVKAAGLIKKLNLPLWTEVHRGRRRRRPEQARRRKNPADRHPWRVRDMAAHYKTDKPFHTGWTSLIGKDDRRYNAGEPVVGVEGAKYLVSQAPSRSARTPGRGNHPVRIQGRVPGPPDLPANVRQISSPSTRATNSCSCSACPRSPARCSTSSILSRSGKACQQFNLTSLGLFGEVAALRPARG